MGTTRAKAGSAEAFRKIDHDIVLEIAKTAKSSQVPYFSLVSAVGANKNSLFLYPQVKGQIEEAVLALQFKHCQIFRPACLVIDGGRGERRILETMLHSVLSAFSWMSDSVDINVKALANVMVQQSLAALAGEKTSEILVNKEIVRIARQLGSK